MMRSRELLPMVVSLAVVVTLISCDPEKDALAVFTHQGLVLLRPARDYIKVAGIVVLPAHGSPEYLDPVDDVSSDPTNYVDFKAVILGQTKTQSTAFEAALSGLTSLMPLSAKLKYKGGQTVQLSQIDTGGRRIPTTTVSSLLKEKTGDQLRSLLKPPNKYRVFVVQEVYSGKSITLKTASDQSLDVSYGDGSSLPDCSSSTGSGSSADKSGSAGSPSQTSSGNGATPSNTAKKGTPSASAKTVSGTQTSSGGGATPSNTGKNAAPAGAKAVPGTGSSSGPSVSLGTCRNGNFALTLQTQDSIPFAVRLNEIVLSDGVLNVKFGDFKFPPNSLGSGEEVEKATAVLDPNSLKGIQPIKGQKQ